MRTYATVRGTFWTRGSGKKLKGDHLGRELALYLMTCSQGTACGIFYLALPTIAHDLGESVEVIREALGRVYEIALYDEAEELCWVPNTAREQIGETLKSGDRRRTKLMKELQQFSGHRFVAAFVEKYSEAYALSKGHVELLNAPLDGGCDGASDAPCDGLQQHAATPSTAQHSTAQLRTDQNARDEDLMVPCPGQPLSPDVIAQVAAGLEVTPAAVREGLKEFVTYWTIGEGAGRTHTLAKWRSKARGDIVEKKKQGKLVEPETVPDPKATAAAIAAREAALAKKDEEHRATLRKRLETQPEASNVPSMLRGIG